MFQDPREYKEHKDCQVTKENLGEMEKRVTVDFLVFLGFMEYQDRRVKWAPKEIKEHLDFMAKRAQKVNRGTLAFLAFLDVLENLEDMERMD